MAVKQFIADIGAGDETTADVDLIFRIYGLTDSYTTPIATTGSHNSDANVGLSGSTVTISNVDVGTENVFKIASVDAAGNESILSASFAVATYILDTYTNAVGAYSLRKLKSTATKAAEIRRFTDDAVTDIFLENSGAITLLSLVSAGGTLGDWIGSDHGMISKWYDQSGNAEDIGQLTEGNQPQLISAGALVVSNGLPALQFRVATVASKLVSANALLLTNTWSIQKVIDITDIAISIQHLMGQHTGAADANRTTFMQLQAAALKNRANFNNGASINTDYSTDITTGQKLISNYANNNNYFWKENAGSFEQAVTGEALTPLNTPMRVGAQGDSSGNPFYGKMQELIFWDSDKSANRIAIETDINSFYSIY